MSGPIVRKYGFPNFEQIFGSRDVEHGVEDSSAPAEEEGSDRPAVIKVADSGATQSTWEAPKTRSGSKRTPENQA